jgi:hypothetical protein
MEARIEMNHSGLPASIMTRLQAVKELRLFMADKASHKKRR